jgi:putative NADPH-quinone reductase
VLRSKEALEHGPVSPGIQSAQAKIKKAGQLAGKGARIIVTTGMPAPIYRWYFGAHSLKSLERNILGFCGFGPIKESLISLGRGTQSAAPSRMAGTNA